MDIYAEVTARIIAQMENGVIPWSKPRLSCGKAISRSTGKPYSLLNQMLLGRPGEYLTFKQCQEAGGKVKKSEKSSMVVFWKWIEQEDEETGEKKEVPFLRYYNVFHIDQCEGITAKHTTETAFPDGAEPLEAAQEIIYDYLSREGVKLSHQEGDRAFYEHGDSKTKKELAMLLEMAKTGDTIITLEVSRLSRSTQQLCELIDIIKSKHLRLVIVGSVTIDCRNGEIDPMSRAFLEMAGVFSALELAMIRARVRSGMEQARSKGRTIGRPKTTKEDIPAIFMKHYPSLMSGKMNVSELARVCGLSRPTVYKYMKIIG